MKIFQYLLATFVASFILVGCASKSNYAPKEVSDNAKLFNKPSDGKAGIYIYRIVSPGGQFEMDLFIDDKFIASSYSNMFYYLEVDGDKEYKISTESVLSPNHIFLKVEKNKLYFIRHFTVPGFFPHPAYLKVASEEDGKNSILNNDMKLGNIFK